MLSIIIPSLNEEKYLPLLLSSIKNQNFSDYELILADAGSTDKTKETAEGYSCKIVSGGLPAKGRNEGAKVAKGCLLFFCDADVILPDGFFENSLNEFNKRKLGVASFWLTPLPQSRASILLLNFFYNYSSALLENVLPHAAMGILIKKDIFEKVGGFDEGIKLAEDHYLVRTAKKLFKAKFGIMKSTHIFVSDRRFKTDGWISTGIKFLFCEMHMIFIGPVRSNIFKYKFGHYKFKDEPSGIKK